MAHRQRRVRPVPRQHSVNSDDIEIYTDDKRKNVAMTWHNLRQQTKKPADIPNYCLADYIAPKDSKVKDYIGGFAVTTGIGIDARVAEFEKAERRLQRHHVESPGGSTWPKPSPSTCTCACAASSGAMPQMKA